jgi:hypothetical protein
VNLELHVDDGNAAGPGEALITVFSKFSEVLVLKLGPLIGPGQSYEHVGTLRIRTPDGMWKKSATMDGDDELYGESEIMSLSESIKEELLVQYNLRDKLDKGAYMLNKIPRGINPRDMLTHSPTTKELERFMPMLGCLPMVCSAGAVELLKAAVRNTAKSPKLVAMILAFLGSAKADSDDKSGDKQDDASNDSGGILLVVVVFAIIGIVQTLKACKHRIKSMLCSTMCDKSVQTDACDTTLVAAAVPVFPEPVTTTIRYRAYDTFSGMIYWTAAGLKFHVDPNCRAIAGNANVRSMAVCKICG